MAELASDEPPSRPSRPSRIFTPRRESCASSSGAPTRRCTRVGPRGREAARPRQDDRARAHRAVLDPGSFVEIDEFARHRSHALRHRSTTAYGDGVVTGYGTVDGRQVCVFAQDFTVFGGQLGEVFGEKIVKVMDLALKTGCPVVGINDCGGARIQEGRRLARPVRRDLLPQRAGVRRHPADLADHGAVRRRRRLLPRASPTSSSWSTRPRTCSSPARMSSRRSPARTSRSRSWAARMRTTPSPASRTSWPRDEEDAIDYVQALLSYLPRNNLDDPPSYDVPTATRRSTDADRELDTLVPDSANQPYDMHEVIEHVARRRRVPRGAGALRAEHRRRLRPRRGPHGRRRRQPAACTSPAASTSTPSEKAARFVRTCDAFNVPVADVRRRARLPARHRPGVGRHHPPRRQAASTPTPRRPSRRSP